MYKVWENNRFKKGYADITVKSISSNAKDTIRIYCAEKLNNFVSSRCTTSFVVVWRIPNLLYFRNFYLNIGPFFNTNKFTVCGVYGNYFYVTYEKNGILNDGFILQRFFPDNIASGELFKQISAKELVVFSGESSHQKLTTNYTGHVSWKVSDESVVYFNISTGTVTAKKPGIAIISATAQGKSINCMVFSVSKWNKPETTGSNNEVYVRSIPAMTGEIIATLPQGTSMTAKGDMENGFGWIYITSDIADGFILISDFPKIDYIFSEYHYYDQGFEVRYESPISKINDYTSVLNDVMMDLFKLKICSYVEPYTSTPDQCKIWTYGYIYKNNLYARCPKTGQHFSDSCLSNEVMCQKLVSEKGIGTKTVGKCLWTGHVSDPLTTSVYYSNLKSAVFTTRNFVKYNPYTDSYYDLSVTEIRENRLYEIVHETGHMFGAVDGYCRKDNGNSHCSNENCYTCNGKTEPNCIMTQLFNPENADTVFCDECKAIIKTYFKN